MSHDIPSEPKELAGEDTDARGSSEGKKPTDETEVTDR